MAYRMILIDYPPDIADNSISGEIVIHDIDHVLYLPLHE